MDLKRGIDAAVTKVVEEIKGMSRPVKDSAEVAQVVLSLLMAKLRLVSKCGRHAKVGNEGVITVEENKGLETETDVVEGMQFDRGYHHLFYNKCDKMITELEDCLVLLHKKLSSPTNGSTFRDSYPVR